MRLDCYGLVLCGGASERMGADKCFISYHGQPQCYHMYAMLQKLCKEVFISSSPSLAMQFEDGYPLIVDDLLFEKSGPIAALLSAWTKYPDKNFVVTGCDYPFLTERELIRFIETIQSDTLASAFFKESENVFEPTLSYYSHQCFGALQRQFKSGNRSLQYFLKSVEATKFVPLESNSMISADTPEMKSKINEMIYAHAGK